MLSQDTKILTVDKGIIKVSEESETYFDGNTIVLRDTAEEYAYPRLVTFSNGIELKVTETQKFKASVGWFGLGEVHGKQRFKLSSNIFDYQCIEDELLNSLIPEDLGFLIGAYYNYGSNNTLSISVRLRHKVKKIADILATSGIPYTVGSSHNQLKQPTVVFNVEFDFDSYISYTEFPEWFWKSKKFLNGLTQELFYAHHNYVEKEAFVLKWKAGQFLKDLQIALAFLGIEALYSTKYGNRAMLKIVGHDSYKFLETLVIERPKELRDKFDYSKLLEYTEEDKLSSVFISKIEVLDTPELMTYFPGEIIANGILTRDNV